MLLKQKTHMEGRDGDIDFLSFTEWILYVIYLTVVRTTSNLPVPHRKFSSLLFFDWNLTYPGWKLYFDRRLTEKFNFHRVEKG